MTTSKDTHIKSIRVYDYLVDPQATHLERKWWHRFMFWKKFRYPKFVVRTKTLTLQKAKEAFKFNDNK